MIPFILVGLGGYLIGDAMKEKKVFADGGVAGGYRVEANIYIPYRSDKAVTYYYVADSNGNVINKTNGRIYRGKQMNFYKFSTKEEAQRFADIMNNDGRMADGGVIKPIYKVGDKVNYLGEIAIIRDVQAGTRFFPQPTYHLYYKENGLSKFATFIRQDVLKKISNGGALGNGGEMRIVEIPNPNAGKWRIVTIDKENPLTDKFYDTKEEAEKASEKIGQINSSGMKIIQLKDKMKVYKSN